MIHIKFHKLEIKRKRNKICRRNIFHLVTVSPRLRQGDEEEKLLISTLVLHKHMQALNINFNIFYHIHGYNILMRNPKRELLKASFNFSFFYGTFIMSGLESFLCAFFCVCSQNHVEIKVSLL